MLKKGALPLGTVLPLLVIAVAGLGVGYGLWNEFLPIAGTVETGEVDADFVLGTITEEDHGKEVGACAVTPSDGDGDGDDDHLQVTITNGYPSYECWVAFQVRNNGSVPIHIYQPDFTDLPPETEMTIDLSACYANDEQVHPGELSLECTLHVHVEQGAGENASYTFAANIEARQFNETRCDGDILVQAINDANANPGPDTIELLDYCTYTLTDVYDDYIGPTGLPQITSDITINGNGATIERSGAAGTPVFRFFYIDASGDLTLNDLNLLNGSVGNYPSRGGALRNDGTAALHGVTISGGLAYYGGGIHNQGTLTISDSTIRDNVSSAGGGGLNTLGGDVTITGSTITANHADNGGGGVRNDRGDVAISNSTISGNNALHIGGGGIANYISTAGSLTLTNVTVTNNSVTAAWEGGGIESDGAPATLSNTIVANNSAPTGPDCYGTLTSSGGDGYNLVEDLTDCSFTPGANDITGADPSLGPLADNGGPTETHALLTGSPAIDAGDSASCPATDQRGVARPQGPDCDIGAYEYEP